MKKIFLSALVVTFGLSMTTAAMAADATDTGSKSDTAATANTSGVQTVSGTVKSMDKDAGTLTVTDPAGNDVELTAKKTDLDAINEGDTVSATYMKSGDVNIASSVSKMGGTPGGTMGTPGTSGSPKKGGSKY